jgi:hypothetical protein
LYLQGINRDFELRELQDDLLGTAVTKPAAFAGSPSSCSAALSISTNLCRVGCCEGRKAKQENTAHIKESDRVGTNFTTEKQKEGELFLCEYAVRSMRAIASCT